MVTNMKKLALLIIFLCTLQAVHAQFQETSLIIDEGINSLPSTYSYGGFLPTSYTLDARIGGGFAFFGNGDLKGFSFNNELNYALSRRFSTGGVFNLAHGSTSDVDGFEATTTAANLDANIYFLPFGEKDITLKIGTGVSGRYVSEMFTNGLIYENGVLIDKDYSFRRGFSVGGSVILGADFRLTERLVVGAKATYQQYSDGDNVVIIGGNLGFRLF